MNGLFFIEECDQCNFQNAFVAYIDPIYNRSELYDELTRSLHFPYFGRNLDALDDLFRDFSWIEEKDIVIVHRDLSGFPDLDLEKYLECAFLSLETWSDGLEHCVSFVFSQKDASKVLQVISRKVNARYY